MNKQIKQRLQQINNGQVPQGYKKTDFGVFPIDWVTDKKLKDIGTFGKGKGLPGNKMCDSGVPCVGYGDIYMKYDSFHFEKAQNFVDEETAKDSIPIEKGTLLFTATGETAEEIGKCVCYNGDETIYAGGDIITFTSDVVNPIFLAYQQYQSYSLVKKTGFGQGHSVVHIQKGNLEKLNVAYPPSTDEQNKIAEILMKWDEAIELYQRQIENLEKQKKVYLSKMFPKKGENVPEYRFKRFTAPWEQRELEELCDITTGKLDANAMVQNGQYNFYTSGVDIYRIDKAAFEGPAITIAGNGASVGYIHLVDGKFNAYQRTYVLTKFSADRRFLYIAIGNKLPTKIQEEVRGSGIPYIVLNMLTDLKIKIPSTFEQKQIGVFFRNIDTLITLHQRKVEKIKEQRKVLQQYLLNGIVRVEL